ncbi:MAG: flagellar export chaperone FliS [Nitrospirae bacterium]|nr:flagellar export chaperone FliS [Nitrospirota bacterium]
MNPYLKYQEINVKTADQGKLILMMYDGAIIFLQQAKELNREKDFIGKSEKITKAQDILFELIAALNMDAGSIATNLKSLYMYMIKRLFDANIKKDTRGLDESLKIMNELRGAWDKIISKPEHKNNTDSKNNLIQQAQPVQI